MIRINKLLDFLKAIFSFVILSIALLLYLTSFTFRNDTKVVTARQLRNRSTVYAYNNTKILVAIFYILF